MKIRALSSKFWRQIRYLKQLFGYEKQIGNANYFEVEFNFQKGAKMTANTVGKTSALTLAWII